jgi:hypothetical protein
VGCVKRVGLGIWGEVSEAERGQKEADEMFAKRDVHCSSNSKKVTCEIVCGRIFL